MNNANKDDGFFTDHAQDQKFLALKQASKIDYYRKENDQLKEQVQNLTTNLRLNKQILAMTETTVNRNSIIGDDGTMDRIKAYQEREEAIQKQMDELTKQRDDGQAQILIFEQMLADFK